LGSRLVVLVVAAVVVLAGGVWLAYRFGAQARAQTPAPQPSVGPAVALAKARDGTLEVVLSAQGRVGPPAGSDAKLAFPLSGILNAIDAHVGDRVVAGQALTSLDTRGLADAVAQAQADVAAADATYSGGATGSAAQNSAATKLAVAQAHADALRRGGEAALSDTIAAQAVARQAAVKVAADQQNLQRQATLLAGGVIANKDVQAARTQLAADLADQRSADAKVAAAGAGYTAALRQAEADVAQARSDLAVARAQGGTNAAQRSSALAKLAAAQRDLENGTLRAPADGVVVSVLKHPGEAVDPTTPVLDVAPPFNREITLAVPGVDARRVHVGDSAELSLVQVHANSHGHVVAVVPAVDPTTQVTTVVVDGLPQQAIAGEAVAARIIVAQARGIVVPSSAVVTDPETGKTVVFVHDQHAKDPFASRDVALGPSDGTSVVVASGLRAGETIAVQGAYNLLAPSGG